MESRPYLGYQDDLPLITLVRSTERRSYRPVVGRSRSPQPLRNGVSGQDSPRCHHHNPQPRCSVSGSSPSTCADGSAVAHVSSKLTTSSRLQSARSSVSWPPHTCLRPSFPMWRSMPRMRDQVLGAGCHAMTQRPQCGAILVGCVRTWNCSPASRCSWLRRASFRLVMASPPRYAHLLISFCALAATHGGGTSALTASPDHGSHRCMPFSGAALHSRPAIRGPSRLFRPSR